MSGYRGTSRFLLQEEKQSIISNNKCKSRSTAAYATHGQLKLILLYRTRPHTHPHTPKTQLKKKKDFPGGPSAGSCPGGTCLPHAHGPAAESADPDASALTTTNELGSDTTTNALHETSRSLNCSSTRRYPPKKLLLTHTAQGFDDEPTRLSFPHDQPTHGLSSRPPLCQGLSKTAVI